MTTELGRKSRPLTLHYTMSKAYSGGKARQTTQAYYSVLFSPLFPLVVTVKAAPLHNRNETQLRLSRLIQPPHSNPCPKTTSNTLRELNFDRMLVFFPSLMAHV